jgi:hypothetical protein
MSIIYLTVTAMNDSIFTIILLFAMIFVNVMATQCPSTDLANCCQQTAQVFTDNGVKSNIPLEYSPSSKTCIWPAKTPENKALGQCPDSKDPGCCFIIVPVVNQDGSSSTASLDFDAATNQVPSRLQC